MCPHISWSHHTYHNAFANIVKNMFFILHFILLWCVSDGGPSYFDFRYKNHLYKVLKKFVYGNQAKHYCSSLGVDASPAAFESAEDEVREGTYSFTQDKRYMFISNNCSIYL